MDDVIFAGTATRPSLGRAEVTLTFDNASRQLPLDLDEVAITRRLYRDGTSDYEINGVDCRLLDIQELLADASVGRTQHVIIGQGQWTRSSTPAPRSTGRSSRKRPGSSSTSSARSSRCAGSTDRGRPAAPPGPPPRGSPPAAPARAPSGRQRGVTVGSPPSCGGLRVYVAGREIAALRAKLTTLADTRTRSADDESQLKGGLARLDADVVALGAELTALGGDDIGGRLGRADQLRERAPGSPRSSPSARVGSNAIAGSSSTRRSWRRSRRMRLATASSLQRSVRRSSGADRTSTPCATEEALFAAERAELLGSLDRAARHIGRHRPRRGARPVAHPRRLRSTTPPNCSDPAASGGAERQARRAGTAQGAASPRLHGDRVARRPADRGDHQSGAAQQRVLRGGGSRRGRVRDAAEDASRSAPRVEALQLALDATQARAGAEHLAAVPGVVGTLLDLVSIDPGWERAVEAALGEALAAVVVRDVDARGRASADVAQRRRQRRRARPRVARGRTGGSARSASRCAGTSTPVAATSTSCSTGCWRTPVASTTSTPRSQQRRASPARSSSPPPATASAPPRGALAGPQGRSLPPHWWRPRSAVPRPTTPWLLRAPTKPLQWMPLADGSPARRRGRRPPRRQRPPVHGLLRGARPRPVGSSARSASSSIPWSFGATNSSPSSRPTTSASPSWRRWCPSWRPGSRPRRRRCAISRRCDRRSMPVPQSSAVGATISTCASPGCASGPNGLAQRLAETERRLLADEEARPMRSCAGRRSSATSLRSPAWPASSRTAAP